MVNSACSSARRINGKAEFSPEALKEGENEEALNTFHLIKGEILAIFLFPLLNRCFAFIFQLT